MFVVSFLNELSFEDWIYPSFILFVDTCRVDERVNDLLLLLLSLTECFVIESYPAGVLAPLYFGVLIDMVFYSYCLYKIACLSNLSYNS